MCERKKLIKAHLCFILIVYSRLIHLYFILRQLITELFQNQTISQIIFLSLHNIRLCERISSLFIYSDYFTLDFLVFILRQLITELFQNQHISHQIIFSSCQIRSFTISINYGINYWTYNHSIRNFYYEIIIILYSTGSLFQSMVYIIALTIQDPNQSYTFLCTIKLSTSLIHAFCRCLFIAIQHSHSITRITTTTTTLNPLGVHNNLSNNYHFH